MQMLEYLKNKRIMVVVAHPDDELLGLGASMNKLINEYNVNTHVVILGEGLTSRSEERDINKWNKQLQIHKKNIKNAQSKIGYNSNSIYDFPDNRFDSISILDIIKVIEKEKIEFKPDIIFTHHGGDLNIDHQITFEAVITATRPMKEEKVKSIITFETPSGTEWRTSSNSRHFNPNLYISFNKKNLDAKIRGMESYEFEKRKFPHPRSPEALTILAQNRGISVGREYAEAFCLIRCIN